MQIVGAYKKPLHYKALKQRLVEVWVDFEQTIVNKSIDQWSKQAFVKAKGQHFEHLLNDILHCVNS